MTAASGWERFGALFEGRPWALSLFFAILYFSGSALGRLISHRLGEYVLYLDGSTLQC
jgi:hypothetical protein